MPGAAIRVIVLCRGRRRPRSDEVAASLVDLLAERGRAVESVVVPVSGTGLEPGPGRRACAGRRVPLVLVTTAREPWTGRPSRPLAHGDRPLRPRRRPTPGLAPRARVRVGSASLPWRPVFAVPVRRRPLAVPAPSPREARGDPAPVDLGVPRRRDPGQGDLLRPPDRRGRRPPARPATPVVHSGTTWSRSSAARS